MKKRKLNLVETLESALSMSIRELTDKQKREVEAFQQSLSKEDEWLFYHLAWVSGPTDEITYEDKYKIMKRWDEFKNRFLK